MERTCILKCCHRADAAGKMRGNQVVAPAAARRCRRRGGDFATLPDVRQVGHYRPDLARIRARWTTNPHNGGWARNRRNDKGAISPRPSAVMRIWSSTALLSALFDLGDDGLPDQASGELAEVATRISACERRARLPNATRWTRLIATHLASRIGTRFDGRISGVNEVRPVRQTQRYRRGWSIPAATFGYDFFRFDESCMRSLAHARAKPIVLATLSRSNSLRLRRSQARCALNCSARVVCATARKRRKRAATLRLMVRRPEKRHGEQKRNEFSRRSASSTEQRNSNMSSITDSLAREYAFGERPWKQAVKRGFFGKRLACGEGKIFKSYLKVNDTCPNCGEELHHQRADDAPPYVTIFVVGHIVGALIHGR